MNKKNSSKSVLNTINTIAAAVLVTTVLASCTSAQSMAQPADVTIKVKILPDPNHGGALCPDSVDLINPDVYSGKFVIWQAVNAAGDNLSYKFDIYFNPFKGQPHHSSAQGKLSERINAKSPKVDYKYTVWDRPQENNDPVCDPLDPRFRVN